MIKRVVASFQKHQNVIYASTADTSFRSLVQQEGQVQMQVLFSAT
jgi:hypothetical protein